MKIDQTIHLSDFAFLVQGAGITVMLCAIALIVGGVIGIVVGVARTSDRRLVNIPATIYVTVIRGTPLLMQLFVIYYVLPFLGIRVSQFAAAAWGLSIYTGGYIAEIVKAGLQAVDKGQAEAAQSLGLRPWQQFRYVTMPQALSVIIPPAFGFFIALIKDSSLVSILGYIELTRAARLVIARTFQPFTIYLAAAVLYFVICYGLSKFETGYLRRRFGQTDSKPAAV